ncbi:MAG: hypothetical protein NTY77_09595 [Elusimicrobia bacterium]|nr:hypothetical protein [Elusimicrobiota bacterium]
MKAGACRLILLTAVLAVGAVVRLGAAEGDRLIPLGEIPPSGGPGLSEHEPGPEELKARDQRLDAFARILRAAVQVAHREAGRRYVDIAELLLDPAPRAGQELATIGLAAFPYYGGDLSLGHDLSGAISLPVLVSEMPPAQRARIADLRRRQNPPPDDIMPSVSHPPHVLSVRGRLAGDAQSGYHLQATGFRDLGAVPPNGHHCLSDLVLGSKAMYPDDLLSMREKLLSALDELKRAGTHAFVPFADLMLDSERYLGRDVATFGAPQGVEANAQNSYFSLRDSLGYRYSLKVVMSGLPLQERALVLRSGWSSLLMVQGRFARTPDGVYYLSASSCAGMGDSDYRSSTEILAPELEPLVPFDGSIRGFRRKASRSVVPESELRARLDEFAESLRASVESIKNDPAHVFAEVGDIGFDPRAYMDRRLAVLGAPTEVAALDPRANLKLGSHVMGGLRLPVSIARFPPEMRKGVLRAEDRHVLVIRGYLRRSEDGRHFLDATGYADLGGPPAGLLKKLSVADLMRGSAALVLPTLSAARQKVAEAKVELERDQARPFVDLLRLAQEPAAHLDRDVATIGVPGQVVANTRGAYADAWSTLDPDYEKTLILCISPLPLQDKKELLRLASPWHALVLRGKVRAMEKGHCLELTGYEDIGPFPRVVTPTGSPFMPWKSTAACPPGKTAILCNWPFLGDMYCAEPKR